MPITEKLTLVFYLLNIVSAIVVIFLERRNVAATWAWLMVLLFLPGFGFLLYLVLGQSLRRRRIFKVKEEEIKAIEERVTKQKKQLHKEEITYNDPESARFQDMIYMNLSSNYAIYTQDNAVEIYTEGQSKFTSLIQSIEQAKDHIHLLYYIVRHDSIGKKILEALISKAREGVQVRVLYDHVGSSGLHRDFIKQLKEVGGEVRAFFPSRIPYVNIRLNYRNHRKLVIIDGTHGFIGGFNIGDEYLGLDKHLGYWRDSHLKITGSAVHMMQARFILDWNLSSPSRIEFPSPAYFPAPQKEGSIGMQIVTSGPTSEWQSIKNGYLKMIHSAKESIYIQTPYFIPDDSLLAALKISALSGVDVRIMLPSKSDHMMIYWASHSYLGELLASGVRCYLYEKGFLHAKVMTIDGKVSSIGSANIDIRSFKLNFEINAFIYDSATTSQLNESFFLDAINCREVTLDEYDNQPFTSRIKESLARLLSPIL
ncbi:cardiolipin synthase [Heliorestis acidaminivorans]|uniref:Cardiolipin synthase n=1 Tax=Heliorestis acidaminivorans TaxID=553427 RepID=A0A6I0ERH6_9FIRM|nr:cardiolipin synthase [Heliorestis acidaminivorans]KAB2952969.1 cardiolipin synthase [Heliorestis acidaminivorans]